MLLREVIWKREPSLLRLVDSLRESPLSAEQRGVLWDLLMTELCETGLASNKELNERGIKLDELIGLLSSLGIPAGEWALSELWRRIGLGIAEEQEKIEVASLSGKSKDSRYIPRLLQLLTDKDEQVRYYALQSLVFDLQQTDKVMEDHCWRLLREDPDEDVRAMAAAGLGKIYFASLLPEAFRQLLAELKNPYQSVSVKGSIYGTLFKVAARPPSEWPGLHGPRKVFEESDIDWEKLAWLEDQMEGT